MEVKASLASEKGPVESSLRCRIFTQYFIYPTDSLLSPRESPDEAKRQFRLESISSRKGG